jgi:hypothetical protein
MNNFFMRCWFDEDFITGKYRKYYIWTILY